MKSIQRIFNQSVLSTIASFALLFGVLTANGQFGSSIQYSVVKYGAGAEAKDFKFLKGEKELNLIYDYSNMNIDGEPEKDYVERKTAEFNKKEKGKGEKFQAEWEANKIERHQKKFEELFNKGCKKYFGIKQGNSSAKYTLIVKPTTLLLGSGMNALAKLTTQLVFKETTNLDGDKLGMITVIGAPGQASFGGFDPKVRMQESFAKTGKDFANFLIKKILRNKKI